MSKGAILAAAVAAALAAYFLLSLYILPQSYQASMEPRRPEPVVADVSLSASEISLGQTFVVSVAGINNGDEADMQIVSIGFPNLTSADNIKLITHDFAQTPILVDAGVLVGSGYAGTEQAVAAQYPSLEAFSRPWQADRTYSADIKVRPEVEGRFVILVKSVAFPHSWERAHYPQEGIIDHQGEFAQAYSVQVTTTKP